MCGAAALNRWWLGICREGDNGEREFAGHRIV